MEPDDLTGISGSAAEFLLGWLYLVVARNEYITMKDWNDAAKAARERRYIG